MLTRLRVEVISSFSKMFLSPSSGSFYDMYMPGSKISYKLEAPEKLLIAALDPRIGEGVYAFFLVK